MSEITLLNLIHEVSELFDKSELYYGHGTDNAEDEAYALIFDALDISYESDQAILQEIVATDDAAKVRALAKQRVQTHIPVPYLTHRAWFCGLPFYIDQRALIPRSPFAEWIDKGFQPWLDPEKVTRVLDLCTGSACIAIACAYAFPHAQVDAVDLSADALEVAKKNVELHALAERVHLHQGDLFTPLADTSVTYDLIISNPPYVSVQEMQTLPQEYKHEPEMALEADDQGLALVDVMLQQAKKYLNDGGVLAIEVGNTQEAMMERYPALALTWLDCEFGGHGMFLVEKNGL